MQKSQRVRAGGGGHHLRHQRDSGGKFSADAEAREEAVEREVPITLRERRQARERGVEQDGQHHRLGAAPAVAEDAEGKAADSPAEHEDGGHHAAVVGNLTGRRAGGQKSSHGGRAGQDENALVHGVERPAERGDGEDPPVISRQFPPPGAGGHSWRGCHHVLGGGLVFGDFLGAIDDHDFDPTLLCFQLQSELLLQGCEDIGSGIEGRG